MDDMGRIRDATTKCGQSTRFMVAVPFFVVFFLLSSLPRTTLAEVAQPWQEYNKVIKSAEIIQSEGSNIFGDSVNLYTGATEFMSIDVSLLGNGNLPVILGRRYSAGSGPRHYPFADWDMDVPYIGGDFLRSEGWIVSSGTAQNRCSSPTSPETAAPPIPFRPEPGWESFNGYRFFSRESGTQSVLFATVDSRPQPTDGRTYKWITNKHWHFSCLPILKSGHSGEGFIAHSPNGEKYYLDWMVKRPSSDILYPVILENGFTGGQVIYRDEIRIYPTRVEDRFGNWVEYVWNGNRLDRISSHDGRSILISWITDASGHEYISKISTNTLLRREWNYSYEYLSGQTQGGFLTTITLPDASAWSIDFDALWGRPYYDGRQEYGVFRKTSG